MFQHTTAEFTQNKYKYSFYRGVWFIIRNVDPYIYDVFSSKQVGSIGGQMFRGSFCFSSSCRRRRKVLIREFYFTFGKKYKLISGTRTFSPHCVNSHSHYEHRGVKDDQQDGKGHPGRRHERRRRRRRKGLSSDCMREEQITSRCSCCSLGMIKSSHTTSKVLLNLLLKPQTEHKDGRHDSSQK